MQLEATISLLDLWLSGEARLLVQGQEVRPTKPTAEEEKKDGQFKN